MGLLDTGCNVLLVPDDENNNMYEYAGELKRPITLKTSGAPVLLNKRYNHKVLGPAVGNPSLETPLVPWKTMTQRFDPSIVEGGFYFKSKQGDTTDWHTQESDGLPYLYQTRSAHFTIAEQDPQANELVWRLHRWLGHAPVEVMLKLIATEMYGRLGIKRGHILETRVQDCEHCRAAKMTGLMWHSNASREHELGEAVFFDLAFFNVADTSKTVLVGVEGRVGQLYTQILDQKTHEKVFGGIKEVLGSLSSNGFKVQRVYTDSEICFKSCRDALLEQGVTMVFSPPGTHQRPAERWIRTLRTNVEVMFAGLGYAMPGAFFPYLLRAATRATNNKPNSKSPNVPPSIAINRRANVMLHQSDLVVFGELGVVHTPGSSSGETSSVHAIFLGNFNVDGHRGFSYFNIAGGKVATGNKFVPTPGMRGLQRPCIHALERYANGKWYKPDAYPQMHQDVQEEQQDTPLVGVQQAEVLQGNVDATTPLAQDQQSETKKDLPLAQDQQSKTKKELPLAQASEVKELDSSVSFPTRTSARQRKLHNYRLFDAKGFAAVEDHREASAAKLDHLFDPTWFEIQIGGDNGYEPEEQSFHVYYALLGEMQEEYHKLEREATLKELQKYHDWKAFKPVHHHNGNVLRTKLFVKEVVDAHGNVTGLKARLVIGGDMQKTVDMDVSTSNVKFETICFMLNAALNRGYTITKADVSNAFLHSPIHQELFIHLKAKLAKEFCEIDPSYKEFLRTDGSMVALLERAANGIRQGAAEFQHFTTQQLEKQGFNCSKADRSLFIKDLGAGHQHYLLAYVDDFLGIAPPGKNDTRDIMQQCFKGFTCEEECTKFEYLGMEIVISEEQVTISQPRYIGELVHSLQLEHAESSKEPCSLNLFEDDEPDKDNPLSHLLGPKCAAEFRSLTMKLMYVATKSRPDVKLFTAYASTKMQFPNEGDWHKLVKCVSYLKGTADRGLVFYRGDMRLDCYADAAHGTHKDGRGQVAFYVTLGGQGSGAIATCCKKAPNASTSSTHAEAMALYLATVEMYCLRTLALYLATVEMYCLRTLAKETGFQQNGPNRVAQDNESTITIMTRGAGWGGKSKMFELKFFWVTEQIQLKNIYLEHVGTKDMLADGFTKPLKVEPFVLWVDAILGKPALNQAAQV